MARVLDTILLKLSEIAHTRRGHNEQRFMAKWRTRIAMTLAKRGAQVPIVACQPVVQLLLAEHRLGSVGRRRRSYGRVRGRAAHRDGGRLNGAHRVRQHDGHDLHVIP